MADQSPEKQLNEKLDELKETTEQAEQQAEDAQNLARELTEGAGITHDVRSVDLGDDNGNPSGGPTGDVDVQTGTGHPGGGPV